MQLEAETSDKQELHGLKQGKVAAQKHVKKSLMKDPWRVDAFQSDLSALADRISPGMIGSATDIDGKLSNWNEGMLDLIYKHFGTSAKRPKKEWISDTTWCSLRWIAPTRRK
eukprot:11937215-Karenia_brevis.AAC.1